MSLNRIFEAVLDDLDMEYAMLDATLVQFIVMGHVAKFLGSRLNAA